MTQYGLRMDMDCLSCSHRKAGKSLFSCLGDGDVARIDDNRMSRTFEAGQTLFLQGDQPTGIYCLKGGLVKLESFSRNGGAQLLRLARPGEPLGYRAHLSQDEHKYRATALTKVRVCALPESFLQELRADVPAFSQALIGKLAKDLQQAEERWLGLMQKNSEQRVAEILLEFHRADEGWPSRKDMAHLVDMAPETFTRILARFESRDWVFRTRRKLKILQTTQLEKLLVLDGA